MICSICCNEPGTDRVTLTSSGTGGSVTLWIGEACRRDHAIEGNLACDWWMQRMISRQQRTIQAAFPQKAANTNNTQNTPLDTA